MITIFNESQSSIVFVLKVMTITSATVMNFFGLGYFHVNWIIGLFCMAVAINVEMAFLAVFDHAFAIPVKADHVRKVARLKIVAIGNQTRSKQALLKRQLRSFPVLGIKVGRFNYLERDSTPTFLDYVATKTASLMVTFQ